MGRRHSLIGNVKSIVPAGAKVLVGVSGGVDSVALLLLLNSLVGEGYLSKVEVAHVDHGIRKGSATDAEFVRGLAEERLKVPFHLSKQSPPAVGNIEAWGRNVRYEFFFELIERQELDWIVTAHHADDEAETLLMRLISNKPLSGISLRSERTRVLRPLLYVRKESLRSYCVEQGVEPREDETNESDEYLRNRVRNRLLPFIESEFEPRATELIAERSYCLTEDNEAFEELVSDVASSVVELQFGSKPWTAEVRVALESLQHRALQWRFVERLLLPKLGFKAGRRASLEIMRVIDGDIAAHQIGGGYEIRRKKGELLLLSDCN